MMYDLRNSEEKGAHGEVKVLPRSRAREKLEKYAENLSKELEAVEENIKDLKS